MKERREILEAWSDLRARGETGVLASVVRVSGSTYRRPGARLLVLPDDQMIGLVSGGCVEGDVLEHARAVRDGGEPRRVHYDSGQAGDLVWGLGLGCAGTLEVLLERVDADHPGPLAWIEAWTNGGHRGVLATALDDARLGRRAALAEGDDRADGPIADTALEEAMREALGTDRGAVLEDEAGLVSIEIVHAPPELTVFGAGPDAVPLVRLAGELGWNTRVVDSRPAFAKPERFPGAEVVCAPPQRAVGQAGLGADTACVVMTHRFVEDRAILENLLDTPCPYIALLGPRQRGEDLLRELEEAGRSVDAGERRRLHSPAGLDLGADAPEEIALSIVAEILAFLRRREGRALCLREGPIHDPDSGSA